MSDLGLTQGCSDDQDKSCIINVIHLDRDGIKIIKYQSILIP